MHTRPVSEVLQNRTFITATLQTPVSVAAEMMKIHHVSAILVINDEEMLVGICTDHDIVTHVVAARLDPELIGMAAIMTRHPQTIDADKPFGHALHMMYEGGFHHIPVVNSIGRPVGILSAHDALTYEAMQFELELVRREEIMVIL